MAGGAETSHIAAPPAIARQRRAKKVPCLGNAGAMASAPALSLEGELSLAFVLNGTQPRIGEKIGD